MNEAKRLYVKAIKHFGVQTQSIKTMEECGELIQALSRVMIDKRGRDHLAEEIADVYIMLEQMQIAYGIEFSVEAWKLKKLLRLDERLNSEL